MQDYRVRRIPGGVGREFIRAHHYTRGCHNGPMTWGLFDGERLIGVCAFATPNSENVRTSVFGEEFKAHVTELHRLVILDEAPTNTASWFIVRALRGLNEERPGYWGVLSFADGSEGHTGAIYQATNALYLGASQRKKFWRDSDGRLRHPRQNGVNITPEEAEARGWVAERRESKHRYLFILGTPAERRARKRLVKGTELPYPKR